MRPEIKVTGGEIATLIGHLQQAHRAMSHELTRLQAVLDRPRRRTQDANDVFADTERANTRLWS